jgi:hypothetical protein
LRLNSRTAGGSGRRKLAVCDWNGDGHFDWLLNSKNADLMTQTPRQTNDSPPHWVFQNSGSLADKNIEGHDVCPTTIDLNSDGLRDFLGGAEDGRMYYLQRQAAPKSDEAQEPPSVDAVYYNGKVVTINSRSEIAQAFAVHKDRIVAVGENAIVRKLANRETIQKDLEGRMVLPGLIDSHVHAPDAAIFEWDHPIPEMETIEDVEVIFDQKYVKSKLFLIH